MFFDDFSGAKFENGPVKLLQKGGLLASNLFYKGPNDLIFTVAEINENTKKSHQNHENPHKTPFTTKMFYRQMLHLIETNQKFTLSIFVTVKLVLTFNCKTSINV